MIEGSEKVGSGRQLNRTLLAWAASALPLSHNSRTNALFRVRKNTQHGFFPDGENFTVNPLTAHTEWLPGVRMRHSVPPLQYIALGDCGGWWLSGCCGSVAEHLRLKLDVCTGFDPWWLSTFSLSSISPDKTSKFINSPPASYAPSSQEKHLYHRPLFKKRPLHVMTCLMLMLRTSLGSLVDSVNLFYLHQYILHWCLMLLPDEILKFIHYMSVLVNWSLQLEPKVLSAILRKFLPQGRPTFNRQSSWTSKYLQNYL